MPDASSLEPLSAIPKLVDYDDDSYNESDNEGYILISSSSVSDEEENNDSSDESSDGNDGDDANETSNDENGKDGIDVEKTE
jgi:hypothetical protein